MALRTKVKYGLSAAMLALIAAGAGAPQLLDQFLQEREGNTLVAVRDNGGVWSVCRGVTRIDGKPVVKGQRLTQSQCDHYNAIERDKALAWVNKNIHVPLTEPQKVGIASFCPYNIGPGKCLPSTFYRKLNAGDRKGACAEIRRWVYDGGK
ncbi:lysozyme, partial [Salmonella enterica]|nr:lysozyme [Salmonella enterica]